MMELKEKRTPFGGASSQRPLIPGVEGKINRSVLTVSRPLASLIGVHYRQTVGHKAVYHIADCLHTATISKIYGDTYLGKAAQRASPHATDNYCLNSSCV